MAAEMVLWENIQKTLATLGRPNVKIANLKHSLEMVRGVLIALEAGDKAVHSRLANLLALLHDADDLLDSIITVSSENSYLVPRGMRCLFSLNANPVLLAWQVGKLGQKIAALSDKLLKVGPQMNICRHTCKLLPDEADIHPLFITMTVEDDEVFVGRDDDMQRIIDLVLESKEEEEESVVFIPLVGSQGLGKTTLAKLLYNDDKIKNWFELRMWVRVSQISDEVEVLQQIVDSCSGRKPSSGDSGIIVPNQLGKATGGSKTAPTNNVEVLEHRLKKEIEGKLYLLVLDDACITVWSHLKDLLGEGARGSRVLVITRSVEVADLVSTSKAYRLQAISEKSSLSLLESIAGVSFKDDHELKEMAKTILQLCGGVPFIIKVLGGLLYGRTREMWLTYKDNISLLNSESGDINIMDRILWLSYNELPTRLKACVGYCSLFPEDFRFNKHDLVSLWMAQGFIEPLGTSPRDISRQDIRPHEAKLSDAGQSLEEAGEHYFAELSRRCFFQDLTMNDSGSIVSCTMHHIMRDLACQTVVGVVNTYITGSDVEHVLDSRYKHVSFSCAGDTLSKIPDGFFQVRSLRSLLWLKEPDCDAKIEQSTCAKLLSKFKCLRVLDLHDFGIEKLPESIGSLIHLRYLDLSKNDGLVTLPQTVTNLRKLQTLKLNACPKLRHLPRNFGNLTNLRRLEIDECDSLPCMPYGLEKLTRLETLSRFVVCKDCSDKKDCARLKALKELQNLRGKLTIEFSTGFTSNQQEVAEANLSSKRHLRELRINWSLAKQANGMKKNVSYYTSQDLLEALQPPPDLEILFIEGYRGDDFPSWARMDMLASSLPNLVMVSIEGCHTCQHLPPFGQLPCLKRLTLRHMANVRFVEQNQYENSPTSTEGSAYESLPPSGSFFKALEELTLHSFHKLEGWWKEIVDSPTNALPCFPCLSKLRIWNCPKLVCMPLFAGVRDLDLWNVNQKLLEECAKRVLASPSSQRLHSLPRFFNTECVRIKGCTNLQSFKIVRESLGDLQSLLYLSVEKCDSLSTFGPELERLTLLEELEISGCKELSFADSLSWRSVRRLRRLTLREIPKMEALPEGLQHVNTLRFLWISTCNALVHLPEWMSYLTALQHLRIESCRALTRLPNGLKSVKTLVKVEITECPELMERCRENSGEEWHKIKHARILLNKTWRYGLMSEPHAAQNRPLANHRRKTPDIKYFIMPVSAESRML